MRLLAKFLKILNSNSDPGEISLGVAFAMIAGFTPLWSLHNVLVLLLLLILRVNLSAFLLALGLFSSVSYALDPLFHRVGLSILVASPLQDLWTALYNSTVWRLEYFNNSIVMGSLVVALALCPPLYFLSNRLIRQYREHVLGWVRKTRFMQMMTASSFYNLYRSVSGWGGAQ
jgi:uncharacterized protein (TIGR03546 family)